MAASALPDVYQLRIRLCGISPLIWRRLWDLLWMGPCAMRRAGGSTLTYQLILNLTGAIEGEEQDGPLYTVKIVCGPGVAPRPVLTFMRPDED
jgi:hypothetical protein